MSEIIMVLPELKPKPVFDLVDPETGLTRDVTVEEEIELKKYEGQEKTWETIESFCNGLPLEGVFQKVISRNSPVYLKGGKRWQVFCLDSDRLLGVGDIDNFIKDQLQGLKALYESVYLDISSSSVEWLDKNGFVPEEIS